ncbi:hypothetical protein SEPCBS119000_004780 [Sporothrix epigloea]|uniref:K Homology domain-containing protein n=1 Tax=Sporothrix epigloea TaxID=1892477 RepID=A0ABP0DVX5_9PEZI
MAEMTNLESILATLAAQKAGATPATVTPPQAQQYYPPPGVSGAPGTAVGSGSYPYPQPTTSGSLDLSGAAAGQASGNVSIQEAIARAKAHAAMNGVASYDRPITYAPPAAAAPQSAGYYDGGRRHRSSHSRSPPPAGRRGGDHNPYRDERREERRDYGGGSGGRGRYSPAHHGDHGGDRYGGDSYGSRRRERSPGGGGNSNFEVIDIQAGLVGLIIGRQGENLRRVETESQCRVQFLAPANPDDEMRQCRITGQPPNRAEAKAAIYKIIADSASDGPPRSGPAGGRFGGGPARGQAGGPGSFDGPDGPGAQPLAEGEECIQIMIPDRTVGLIIGRGGETIRDLQERSGCHINIVGEAKSVSGLRPVNLIGGRAETTHAKELIMEIVDSDTRNGGPGGPGGSGGPGAGAYSYRQGGGGGGGPAGYAGAGGYGGGYGAGGGGGGDRQSDSVFVPAEAVGMIIGKGGETIREMQSTTGCKINVSQTPGANENEREIGLLGSREAIERAKASIEEKVEAVRQKNSGGGYHSGGGGRGRGGRDGGDGGGYRQHRDYDNPGYGGGRGDVGAGRGAPSGYGGGAPASAQGMPGSDDPNADPYAAYGGYAAYVALWYQALAQQQQGAGGGPPPAPGQ